MFGILIFIEILVSILLIVVVLMQSSKGGGLAGTLGGSTVGTMFGVRRTADFLSKATMYLSTIFILLCLLINIFFLPGKTKSAESIIQRGSAPASAPRPVPPANQPAATPAQQAPGK
ncbi:MAG TPA: preprotein translocase subunit SecG [Bacteroidota bacterium]|nr:preprotein translocase subunit SecG [Bacteroidota bacterium]